MDLKLFFPLDSLSIHILSEFNLVTRGLSDYLNDPQTEKTPLIENLLSGIGQRFKHIEEKTTLAQATLLDPRFKREIFSCEGAVLKKHEQTIVDAITPMFQTGDTFTEAATSTAGPDEPPKKKERSYTDYHRQRLATLKQQAPQLTGPAEELKRHMNMTFADLNEDPLIWWREHEAMFLHLAKLARKSMFIPGTSVPSEHLFSKSGELVRAKRSLINFFF